MDAPAGGPPPGRSGRREALPPLDLPPGLFEQLKQWVEFTESDAAQLRALLPLVRPHFPAIADHFYERVLAFPDAVAVFTEGPAQVERLKQTMMRWLETGLSGPHDYDWFLGRARIGQVHVLIGLPQHFMFTAMNVMRVDIQRRVLDMADAADAGASGQLSLAEARDTMDAIDRLLDIELAIMLHTYREDSEKRMRDRERLATIGQLAASIGHDLRNPLGVIESSLFIMRRRAGEDEKLGRHIGRISEQVAVANRIVTDLLEMARNRAPSRKSEHVATLVRQALESIPNRSEVRIDVDVPDDLTCDVDGGLISQAIMNLVTNGIHAVGRARATDGSVRIEARSAGPREDVLLTVRDTGPGFDPRVLNRVFEPLFSTKAKGTGLGLALVKSIVERHGGRATAHNAQDGGAVVTLRLPGGDHTGSP